MSKRDYYEVLGVAREADAGAVKRAFRQAAIKYHPDKNPDDPAAEDRFKEASEAYQVLSDAEKRRLYDAYGHDGLSAEGFGGGFGGGFEDIFAHFGDVLGDIFGNRRGGGGGRRRPRRRGADLRYDLELTFEQAAFGVEREITFHRRESCDPCGGSGAKPGTKPSPCGSCQGTGRITRQQGFFMVQTPCPVCGGNGHKIEQRCSECAGGGSVEVERTVKVTVPPGVDDGVRMRLAGEGESGDAGAGRGDLYVFLHVTEHERFQRDGADVHSQIEISFSQATLGDEVEVETLHGTEQVRIPPGTQPSSVIRLRRKGIARLNRGGHGDHFVTLNLVVPERLSKPQKKALKELREAGL